MVHAPPYRLDRTRRDVVLQAIQGVCAHRGWNLLAAHVRSNHVHTIVEAEAPPERIRNDYKAYASRHLNRMGLESPGRKRWGSPWKHAMALESEACLGGHPVCPC
jgi:REP element-mobilizing transposase RayT